MAFMDKLGAGLEQVAREVEQALDRGKDKVGELQIEMQMDKLAKRLGYLVFDFYRGRPVDQAVRQKVLDDLSRLEDQLWQMRADAAARADAEAQARAARKAEAAGEQPSDQEPWEQAPSSGEGPPREQTEREPSPTGSDWDLGNPPQQPGPGGEGNRPPNP
jgi:hypothetical protein